MRATIKQARELNTKQTMNTRKMESTFKISSARLWILFALMLPAPVSHAQLVHPGGWHTQADLTTIRTKIKAEEEPWITGWNAAKDEGPDKKYKATVSRIITDKAALSRQGHNTYRLVMKWVATGDREYADAAIGIIDEWVETVEGFDVWGPTLTLSSGGGFMAQAAEILAHGFEKEAGWPPKKIKAAQAWFERKLYIKWTNTGTMRSANWGTSCVGGNMSMAVFCDSKKMLSQQIKAYKSGYQDTHDGCAGVAQYIFSPTGQAFESGRDQAHVQGGIAHLVEAALCAWNQGVDLVSYADYRLVAGVEYHARYNVGHNDLPWTSRIYNPCKRQILGSKERISPEERGFVSPIYFMCNKLFTEAGRPHPNTDEVIAHPDYLPEFSNTSHPGMGQFTFATRGSFTPNPSKKYYIDSPSHNLRLGANGEDKTPFTTSISTTGAQVEWAFVAKGNGSWHIQLASGGSKSRLRPRSRSNGRADMRAATSSGALTYYDFTAGALPDTYFATVPKTDKKRSRLQIDDSGDVTFVSSAQAASWQSLKFTEVE